MAPQKAYIIYVKDVLISEFQLLRVQEEFIFIFFKLIITNEYATTIM